MDTKCVDCNGSKYYSSIYVHELCTRCNGSGMEPKQTEQTVNSNVNNTKTIDWDSCLRGASWKTPHKNDISWEIVYKDENGLMLWSLFVGSRDYPIWFCEKKCLTPEYYIDLVKLRNKTEPLN